MLLATRRALFTHHETALNVAATVALALAVGFLSTFRLLGHKPLPVLRRE